MKRLNLNIRSSIKLTLVAVLQMATLSVSAQALTAKEWTEIQRSNKYLIGSGMSTSIEEARQSALSDLASKISVKVSSRFDYHLINENKGQDVNSETRMNSVINSYSSVTLKNVDEYVVEEKNKFVVYRYMKESDMRAMFKRRVGLAKKWANEAIECEKEGKIGDALQGFYWALALLNSCPDADLETIDYSETSMDQDLHRRVKEILESIIVKATSVEKDHDEQYVTLEVLYKGKPAKNFKYKYTHGKGETQVYAVKNGEGEIVLPLSTNLRRLKIEAEYECRDEANIHPDVRSVMEFTDPMPFATAVLNVDTKACQTISNKSDYVIEPLQPALVDEAGTALYETLTGSAVATPLQTMQIIEKGISQRDFQSLRGCFTDEGWKMFDALIHYGNAKLTKAPEVQFLPDKDGGYICRCFPMSFTFKSNSRTFIENVVFYLNKDAKVKEVAFGLEKAALNDIMGRGIWKQEERQVLVHFLETYKTAYALKRLDYIDAIFSDNALIITGSVVKSIGHSEMQNAIQSKVNYIRQSKEQYINNLKKCFASNEFVNIHFGDNIIRRSNNNTNFVGIQIKQDYFSSTYGDTGYLFLMVDFRKPEEPVIHVRTWQPDLDPNVNDGRYSMRDFEGVF